jgi:hypothetical protein
MSQIDDFESLLSSSQEPFGSGGVMTTPSPIQTAQKNANLFDFVKMISMLVTTSLDDLKAEFVPDEGREILLDPNKKIDHPYITYKVVERIPKKEIKARERQDITEQIDPEEQRIGAVWGQKFSCIVQFNIFASEYEAAEQVMERFEDMMLTYTGFYKKNGVGELYFKKQYTDEGYNTFRQILSVRNLQYYVEIEKLTVIFKETIKQIQTISLEEKEA